MLGSSSRDFGSSGAARHSGPGASDRELDQPSCDGSGPASSSGASFYRAVYNAKDAVRELIRAGKLELPLSSLSGRAPFGTAQARLVEALAGNVVKHVIIEDAGHFVVEEQSEAVTAELLSLFRS